MCLAAFLGRKIEVEEQVLFVFPGNTTRRPSHLIAPLCKTSQRRAADLTIGAYDKNGRQRIISLKLCPSIRRRDNIMVHHMKIQHV